MVMKDWYYPHEEYFFWCLVAVAFLVALSLSGYFFLAALFLFSPIWIGVYIFWWALRVWYIDRERKNKL
jgi:hypothetical protein